MSEMVLIVCPRCKYAEEQEMGGGMFDTGWRVKNRNGDWQEAKSMGTIKCDACHKTFAYRLSHKIVCQTATLDWS